MCPASALPPAGPGTTSVARRPATFIGYLNAFVLYTAASVIAVPLVFMVKGRRRIAVLR